MLQKMADLVGSEFRTENLPLHIRFQILFLTLEDLRS